MNDLGHDALEALFAHLQHEIRRSMQHTQGLCAELAEVRAALVEFHAPESPTHVLCQSLLEDGCDPVVLAPLSDAGALPDWLSKYVARMIEEILPTVVRGVTGLLPPDAATALEEAATRCERERSYVTTAHGAAGALKRAAGLPDEEDDWEEHEEELGDRLFSAIKVGECLGCAADESDDSCAILLGTAVSYVSRTAPTFSENDAILNRCVAILLECHRDTGVTAKHG